MQVVPAAVVRVAVVTNRAKRGSRLAMARLSALREPVEVVPAPAGVRHDAPVRRSSKPVCGCDAGRLQPKADARFASIVRGLVVHWSNTCSRA